MADDHENPRRKRPLESVMIEQYVVLIRILSSLLANARATLLDVAREKGISLDELNVAPNETFIDLDEDLPEAIRVALKAPTGATVHRMATPPPPPESRPAPPPPVRRERRPNGITVNVEQAASDDGDHPLLSKAEFRLLRVAAQRPGSNAEQLALLAGYTMSGGVAGALASLRRSGFMQGCDATDEGLNALGPFEKLPTGSAMRTYWIRWLAKNVGRCASRILQYACDQHPNTFAAEEIAHALGYSMSGGVAGAIAKMRQLELVSARGKIVVNPQFFEEPKRKRRGTAA